jgi:pilus assembly protein CpaB
MNEHERSRHAARLGAAAFALVALVCAALAAYLTSRLVRARDLAQERRIPIVVTQRAIAAAEPLGRDALRMVAWPESNLPPGAVTDLESLFQAGRQPVAASGMQAGEPVVRARLADPARGTAMAALVRDGYRAVAVRVDNAITRAGLLYPGAHVDLVGTVRNTRTFVVSTRIAIENIRVLSVEAHTDVETFRQRSEGAGGAGGGASASAERQDAVVTLEVTPEQAELAVLAEREGKVDLALRNAGDLEPVATAGVTPMRFNAGAAHAEERPAEPAPPRREGARPAATRRRHEEVRAQTTEAAIETYHAK